MPFTRTQNTIRNLKYGFVAKIINLVLQFVVRSVLINSLGIDYLGVNGLFKNVLNLLSFAELGFSSAVAFNLYKPMRNGDKEKIKSIMAFYRTVYFTIGAVIALLGVILIPFLPYMIKGTPRVSENLVVIYLLFLANTVVSYYFIYKKNLLIADQKSYIDSLYTQSFECLRVFTQIAVLLWIKSYIVFLLVQIISTVAMNFAISAKADRTYPYLKDKDAVTLSREEKKGLFANVRAIAIYKFCAAILTGMPNVIISKVIGITAVGLTSNYVLITTGLTSIFNQLTIGSMSSIGNLNADDNGIAAQKSVFDMMQFAFMWIYGYLSVCFFCLANRFITAWIGSEFVLSQLAVFAITLYFFAESARKVAYMFRMTLGYFMPGRYAAVASILINVPLAVILAHVMGVAGIFFAASISLLCTFWIVDPYLIFTRRFRMPFWSFYIYCLKLVCAICIIGAVIFHVNNVIPIEGFTGFIVCGAIDTVIYNLLMFALFHKRAEFIRLREKVVRKFG